MKALARKAVTFATLNADNQWQLARAAFELLRARLRVARAVRPADRVPEHATPSDEAWGEILEHAWALRLVLKNWPSRSPCLLFADALRHMTAHHGAVLRVGVMRAAGDVKAHAWVEYPAWKRRLQVGGEGIEWKPLRSAT